LSRGTSITATPGLYGAINHGDMQNTLTKPYKMYIRSEQKKMKKKMKKKKKKKKKKNVLYRCTK
jgi:hypothetical protein